MQRHVSPDRLPDASRNSVERPGFRSFKTVEAIVYPCRWHRDVLLQATLEQTIEKIGPARLVGSDDPETFAIFAWIGGTRRLVVAVRGTPDRTCLSDDPDRVTIARADVLSEPRCSTARSIWSTRKIAVPAGDRLRVLARLDQAERGVELGVLAGIIRCSSIDGVEAVLALVCAGQSWIGIDAPLSPETIVTRRRPA